MNIDTIITLVGLVTAMITGFFGFTAGRRSQQYREMQERESRYRESKDVERETASMADRDISDELKRDWLRDRTDK